MLEFSLMVLVPFIAILFEGLHRKIEARFQNRIGPPIWQPFWDLWKLWQKKPSESMANDNVFFTIPPVLYFITSLSLFLFVPFFLVSFEYDFILLIYITILYSGFYVVTAFASNSPSGIVGAMREIITMVPYEMILALSIFSFMLAGNATTLAGYTLNWGVLYAPLAAICLLFVTSIEVKITPFDTAEAPPEVMDGYRTEFTGKGLALLELSRYIKLAFFSFLSVMFLFGKADLLLFYVLSFIFLFFLTMAKATTPRLRVDQTLKIYMVVLVLSLIEISRIIMMG